MLRAARGAGAFRWSLAVTLASVAGVGAHRRLSPDREPPWSADFCRRLRDAYRANRVTAAAYENAAAIERASDIFSKDTVQAVVSSGDCCLPPPVCCDLDVEPDDARHVDVAAVGGTYALLHAWAAVRAGKQVMVVSAGPDVNRAANGSAHHLEFDPLETRITQSPLLLLLSSLWYPRNRRESTPHSGYIDWSAWLAFAAQDFPRCLSILWGTVCYQIRGPVALARFERAVSNSQQVWARLDDEIPGLFYSKGMLFAVADGGRAPLGAVPLSQSAAAALSVSTQGLRYHQWGNSWILSAGFFDGLCGHLQSQGADVVRGEVFQWGKIKTCGKKNKCYLAYREPSGKVRYCISDAMLSSLGNSSEHCDFGVKGVSGTLLVESKNPRLLPAVVKGNIHMIPVAHRQTAEGVHYYLLRFTTGGGVVPPVVAGGNIDKRVDIPSLYMALGGLYQVYGQREDRVMVLNASGCVRPTNTQGLFPNVRVDGSHQELSGGFGLGLTLAGIDLNASDGVANATPLRPVSPQQLSKTLS